MVALMEIKTIKDYLEQYEGQYNEIEVYRLTDSYCKEKVKMGLVDTILKEELGIISTENYNKYSVALHAELYTPDEYDAIFDYCSYGADPQEGNTLIIIYEDDGFLPDEEEWEKIENGILSDEIIGAVCYAYNKRAKNNRVTGALLASNYVREREEAHEKKSIQEEYYTKKDKILSKYQPVALHYDADIKQYYLYYTIGGFGFHHPINKPEMCELPLKNVDGMFNDVVDEDVLYCDRFCDLVFNKLMQK